MLLAGNRTLSLYPFRRFQFRLHVTSCFHPLLYDYLFPDINQSTNLAFSDLMLFSAVSAKSKCQLNMFATIVMEGQGSRIEL